MRMASLANDFSADDTLSSESTFEAGRMHASYRTLWRHHAQPRIDDDNSHDVLRSSQVEGIHDVVNRQVQDI